MLDEWLPTLSLLESDPSTLPAGVTEKRKRYTEKERANIVSAAACYLASIEREAHKWNDALAHIDLALDAGARSYIVRRADAYMTKGQILADRGDSQAIEAFRKALAELQTTDRVGAIIRVHQMLGEYLISQGSKAEGEAELAAAFALANVPTRFSATAADENTVFSAQDGESFINN